MFGSHKALRKEKNAKENGFVIFVYTMKSIKENQI